jgi:hypothetical protein
MSFGTSCFVCGGWLEVTHGDIFYHCKIEDRVLHAACLGAHVHSPEGDCCYIAGGLCHIALEKFTSDIKGINGKMKIVGWPPSSVMKGWKEEE